MELYRGALDVEEILIRWFREEKNLNYGAFIPFIGIVRDENGISGLSFDIYEPMLLKWFSRWDRVAKSRGAKVRMAHSYR